MLNQKIWVIRRKQDGLFVNVRPLKKGCFYTLYNGRTTGFAGYTSEDTMRKDLEMLGEGFIEEYICFNDIPPGARVSILS